MVELTGWEPDLVREGLERRLLERRFVAQLAPAGVMPPSRAAASFEAIARLRGFTQRLIADVDNEAESASSPASC